MAGNLRPLTPVERKLVMPLVGKTMLELGNKRNDRGVYKAAFEAAGFSHASVDLNGKDGALRKDLQRPLKLGRFDMVTNFGTTEHVAEQEPAWRNIVEAAASVVVSTTPSPGSWPRHGKWYPTEEFYHALADLNGFRVERLYRDGVADGKELVCARLVRVSDKGFTMPPMSMIYDNGDYGLGEAA